MAYVAASREGVAPPQWTVTQDPGGGRSEQDELVDVLVTAGAAEVDAVSALDDGADDYVSKTVPLVELVARVRSQLRRADDSRRLVEGRALDHRRLFDVLVDLDPMRSVEHDLDVLCRELVDLPAVAGAAVVSRLATGSVVLAVRGDVPYLVGASLPPLRGADETDRPRGTTLSVPVTVSGRSIGSVDLVLTGTGGDLRRRALAAAQDAATVAAILLGRAVGTEDDRDALDHLNQVIAGRAFRTAFQPVVSLTSGAVVGYEALTRFDDGCRPDLRFAEARRLGVGFALERVTLDNAVAASRHLPPGTWLSLNCSAMFLSGSEGLASMLASADREVVLEITETDPIEDYERFLERFDRLGTRVRLAVDDAGAGHASLRHVASLDPPIVKLDRSLVSHVDSNATRLALVAGMAHFARTTDRSIIAEGVEREEEADALRSLGISMAQGYLFGRPAVVSVAV